MSELIIDKYIISAPIDTILKAVARECHKPLFHSIELKGNNVSITCPMHSDGCEKHPSCSVYAVTEGDVEYGFVHCFTCGYNAPLYKMVADCFEESEQFGKDWLIDRFGGSVVSEAIEFPEITFSTSDKALVLDESILDKYAFYHPYMFERKLTKEVVRKFRVGYDRETDSLVFPVWDEHNRLVAITRRSVSTKRFQLESDIIKPVYLYNFIKNEHISTVYVCESQINALTLWSYGYPAIALFGTGSAHQYEVLKKSGIRRYILCFDGDSAGDKGAMRFINNLGKCAFIMEKKVPRGKDVNDLSKEEFDNLEVK